MAAGNSFGTMPNEQNKRGEPYEGSGFRGVFAMNRPGPAYNLSRAAAAVGSKFGRIGRYDDGDGLVRWIINRIWVQGVSEPIFIIPLGPGSQIANLAV